MQLPSSTFYKRLAKFGLVSGVATLVDFLLFRFVFYLIIPIFWAELLSSFIGMLINFFLQKKFVFEMKREVKVAFVLSLVTSLIVMLIGSFVITQLNTIPYLAAHISIAKLMVIGMKFGMNFFIKQWVFEKKMIRPKMPGNQEN